MTKQTLIQTLIVSSTAMGSMMGNVASAAITPSCINESGDCQNVVIESVELKSRKSCHYNPRAHGPADDSGAVQCEYNVTYTCDGVEHTNVLLSPTRFGCAVVE